MRSKCSNRRRALSTNYSSCSARCAARARRTRAHRPRVRAHVREFTAWRRRQRRRVQRLFRSFREASISSATRRETPASCLVCHDRPSRTRYSSLPPHPPAGLGALYFERVGTGNGRNGSPRRRTTAENGSTCGYIDSFLVFLRPSS